MEDDKSIAGTHAVTPPGTDGDDGDRRTRGGRPTEPQDAHGDIPEAGDAAPAARADTVTQGDGPTRVVDAGPAADVTGDDAGPLAAEAASSASGGVGTSDGAIASDEDEVAQLRGEVARAEARAAEAYAETTTLREQLRAASDGASVAEALRSELGAAAERERAAAGRYRELVLRAEPALPADLIAGDTVDAIDDAVAKAREIVARVRTDVEQQTQAGRVPAGAPVRAAPDISTMSAEQKIRYGLTQRR